MALDSHCDTVHRLLQKNKASGSASRSCLWFELASARALLLVASSYTASDACTSKHIVTLIVALSYLLPSDELDNVFWTISLSLDFRLPATAVVKLVSWQTSSGDAWAETNTRAKAITASAEADRKKEIP